MKVNKCQNEVLSSINKKRYSLLFPLDFAGTLCARDGIKTGPHSPNGEDAYDRKLVAMRIKKRRILFTHDPTNARIEQSDVAMTMGAERNRNASNNNPLVVTCYSSPQDHCITRGFMKECSPTINAAAGISGNNRPFIVAHKKTFPINSMVIGKDGGDGDRQTFGIGSDKDACPTIQTAHHHAVGIVYIDREKQGVCS